MNPTPENESVIRKIQKLLALAGNNSNENEVSAVMDRVQSLLSEYNLSMAIVNDTCVAGGTKEAEPEKRESTKLHNRTAKYEWQQVVYRALSEANFCVYDTVRVFGGWVNGKEGGQRSKVPVKRHMILGRESNVMSVQVMGEYLEDTIERLLPYSNRERHSRDAISWKLGCARRLAQRITDRALEARSKSQEEKKAKPDSTGLALVDYVAREQAANYDAKYGDGAWARSLARKAEWEASTEERNRLAVEKAQEEHRRRLNETPAERAKREAQESKEERANQRYWAAQDRKEEAKANRVNLSAYNAGSRVGGSIQLNDQVGSARDKERIG